MNFTGVGFNAALQQPWKQCRPWVLMELVRDGLNHVKDTLVDLRG